MEKFQKDNIENYFYSLTNKNVIIEFKGIDSRKNFSSTKEDITLLISRIENFILSGNYFRILIQETSSLKFKNKSIIIFKGFEHFLGNIIYFSGEDLKTLTANGNHKIKFPIHWRFKDFEHSFFI